MTLQLKSDVAAGLETLAAARGLSVEGYLEQLVNKELSGTSQEPESPEGSGMVSENGLLVYRTGNPLPASVVDDAMRRSREERSHHILGNRS